MSTATELKAAERTVVGFNGSFSTPRMKSRSAHKRHRVRRPVKAERQYLGKTELIETRDKRFKKGLYMGVDAEPMERRDVEVDGRGLQSAGGPGQARGGGGGADY